MEHDCVSSCSNLLPQGSFKNRSWHFQWLSIISRIRFKLLTMAFRTLNALLPGYTVYLIPDHSAPCSSTLGGLSVGLQALQATPAALLLGMLFLQVVRTLPPSFHSVSTQMLSHRLLKHCPLFSSLLIPYLAYFFSSEHLSLSDARSRSRTHNLSLSPIKCKLHVGRDCFFFSPL